LRTVSETELDSIINLARLFSASRRSYALAPFLRRAETMSIDTESGAAVYSPLTLALYDAWVLGVSNRFAWQCSTREVLLPFFKRHVGLAHLDVGVGTGFYLEKADLPASTEVTLMDLNASSLAAAKRRFGRSSTRTVRHDVMQPWPEPTHYDSISLFYLLHCLPGTLAEKASVFANLKTHLMPDGVLFGATILGDSAGHNGFGQKLMAVYNRKGIFSNRHDDASTLEQVLRRHFGQVDITVKGKVALFTARQALT
jgi:SAM-dependent methyltransferase